MRVYRRLGIGALLLGALALWGTGDLTPAVASSHREAPSISDDPAADATDFYMFRSPTEDKAATGTVTLIANYWPLEEPGGGPNFPRLSKDVVYQVKIDNDGDAVEDITY